MDTPKLRSRGDGASWSSHIERAIPIDTGAGDVWAQSHARPKRISWSDGGHDSEPARRLRPYQLNMAGFFLTDARRCISAR
jgi:hypothetical protein